MNDQDLINLLKSGNFTIAYHDNQDGCVYEGRIDNYGKLPEDGEVDDFYSWDHDGYLPYIVKMLVKALGGEALSI
jgi:hypothetical protein